MRELEATLTSSSLWSRYQSLSINLGLLAGRLVYGVHLDDKIQSQCSMLETLTFENFDVTVIRSSRRKTATIKVDLEGVSVRIPADLPLARIEKLVAEKTAWIERKLAEAKRKQRGIAGQVERSSALADGSRIMVQGQHLPLRLIESDQMKVVQSSDRLEVYADADSLADTDQLRALVEQWLYRRAVEELNFCVNVYKQRVGATPSRIQIKDYRARWGSCKPDGSIQLNWRLIHAPMHIMDYVVVHELCHLLEMNYSKHFWSEVERVEPQYKMKRQWLKDNGWQLSF